jgi:hypothetical protein
MIITDGTEKAWLEQLTDFVVDLESRARAARALLESYRLPGKTELSLKEVVRDAYARALCDGADPATRALQAIANRARDVENHLEDDTAIYQDVKAWLLYEASLQEEQ